MKVKCDLFNYWSSASKIFTISYAKETESDLVECSESNDLSNEEPVEVDSVAEESQVTVSITEGSNL